jgi:hypothetical protein
MKQVSTFPKRQPNTNFGVQPKSKQIQDFFALKFTQEMYTNSFAYEVMRITMNPEDSDKFATNGM